MENQFFVDPEYLSPEALSRKHQLETDPVSRTGCMTYLPGTERIQPDVMDKAMTQMGAYEPNRYTARDMEAALVHETRSIEDFRALFSPAVESYLEWMVQWTRLETRKHFGNMVYPSTPLYIANYCENYCIYCGFDCYNHIKRMKPNMEQIEHEMRAIVNSGMEEVLPLTGESRSMSRVEYIGGACKLTRKYFHMVGSEICPVNSDECCYLRAYGANYVTVFQETYDLGKYETLHLMGHKWVWPYRSEAQERAMMGGMRGVGSSVLLRLMDFRKDALATDLHVYYLQYKYPHAKMSLFCPWLRPITNNDKINPRDVHERQLYQVLCIYRTLPPFTDIAVPSRGNVELRNGIVKIIVTEVSTGIPTGIGDHESKCTDQRSGGAEENEQFEISDGRSFAKMYDDMSAEDLQPMLNDYLYV